jgi:hypothetical protein
MAAAYHVRFRERVDRLPDGRLLVSRRDDTVAVIDTDGSLIEPSPFEVVALQAMARMDFPPDRSRSRNKGRRATWASSAWRRGDHWPR